MIQSTTQQVFNKSKTAIEDSLGIFSGIVVPFKTVTRLTKALHNFVVGVVNFLTTM